MKANQRSGFYVHQSDGSLWNFVYMARRWGVSTVEKLIDTLDMGDYVGKDSSKVQKSLDFMIEDLTP